MTNKFEKRQNIKVAFNVQKTKKTREKNDINKKNKNKIKIKRINTHGELAEPNPLDPAFC